MAITAENRERCVNGGRSMAAAVAGGAAAILTRNRKTSPTQRSSSGCAGTELRAGPSTLRSASAPGQLLGSQAGPRTRRRAFMVAVADLEVLKLRAVRCNGDFDAYFRFHQDQELRRIHESRYANGVIPLAA